MYSRNDIKSLYYTLEGQCKGFNKKNYVREEGYWTTQQYLMEKIAPKTHRMVDGGELYKKLKGTQGIPIFTEILKDTDLEIFKDKEPYGEGNFFVIFKEQDLLRFRMYARHLRKLLFEAPIDEMPLLINLPVVGIFSKWRLQISK